MDKALGSADARTKFVKFHWYVPHYKPSIPQQSMLYKPILSKTSTELRYIGRSVFMEKANNQNLGNFELSSQESMTVPFRINIGFQQREKEDSQNLNIDAFCRLPVTSAQKKMGRKLSRCCHNIKLHL